MKPKPGFINVQTNNNVPGAIMPSDKKIVVSKNGPYIVTGAGLIERANPKSGILFLFYLYLKYFF